MLFRSKATDVLTERPACDVCKSAIVPRHAPAIVDGATTLGPWAYLCAEHYDAVGRGLGVGVGQVLLCGDDRDSDLIRRFRLAPDVRRLVANERRVVANARQRAQRRSVESR